jgi:N-acetylglutamate synthase-like GNAT family acetyltransferase
MTIRKYIDGDFEQIKKLAVSYNLNLPEFFSNCYVAVDKDDKIIAFAVIRYVPMIEPFISDNSLAGKRLFDMMIKELKENKMNLVCRCNIEPENKDLLEKLGFEQVFEDSIQMELLKR